MLGYDHNDHNEKDFLQQSKAWSSCHGIEGGGGRRLCINNSIRSQICSARIFVLIHPIIMLGSDHNARALPDWAGRPDFPNP